MTDIKTQGDLQLLSSLIATSKTYINYFFDNLDLTECQKIISLCINCQGLLIFTGVGKSGYIAEKVAATLTSTGTKALYIPPSNFLHGDIGIVSGEDLVIFLSKSGESDELLDLVPFLERRLVPLITWTSCAHSRLAKKSTHTLLLPLQQELCPFNLVPTTSSELQLLFGDILAIALMQQKQFALDHYAQNHPLGAIGKKLLLRVRDLMIQGDALPLCYATQTLSEVLVELTQKQCGIVLVIDHDMRLEGVFTDGDLRRALQHLGTDVIKHSMRDLMTKSAIVVNPDLLAVDAIKILQQDHSRWVMTAPVVYEESVVGLLRLHDIVHAGLSLS